MPDAETKSTIVYECQNGHERTFDVPFREVEERIAYYHADPCEWCESWSVELSRIERQDGSTLSFEKDGQGVKIDL